MLFDSFRKSRFWNLIRSRDERELRVDELEFIDRYRDEFPDESAREVAELECLAFLRSEAMEPSISEGFNDRVMLAWREERRKSRFAYWSPALIGAGITALAVFTILQIISLSQGAVPTNKQYEARLDRPIVFPQPDVFSPTDSIR